MQKRRGTLIPVILALAVLAFALSRLIPILLDDHGSKSAYEELEGKIVVAQEDGDDGDHNAYDWRHVSIDFEALKAINPDVAAWIRFDDPAALPVNYPVLYSGDNDTYLRRDLYGNSHTAGSIFLEQTNSPDFSDYHSILYGHNMKNGTMFGGLKKYKKESFFENHPYFTVYTENTAYRYQIFSFHEVEADSEIYRSGFGPDETYGDYLKDLASRSMLDTGVIPKREQKSLTLSTCTSGGDDKRFVVHAVCIGESSYPAEAKMGAGE